MVQSEKLMLTSACDRALGSVDTLRKNVVAETWGGSEFVSVTSLFYIIGVCSKASSVTVTSKEQVSFTLGLIHPADFY